MADLTTTRNVASPVDFERYGDYAPPRPKGTAGNAAAFERPRYVFQGRISADGSSGFPAAVGGTAVVVNNPAYCFVTPEVRGRGA
jgi:hypothetical protein